MVTPALIRSTAVDMACEIGIINLTRLALCEKLKIADGSFTVIAGMTFTDLIRDIGPECKGKCTAKPEANRRTDKETRMDHILTVALDTAEADGFGKLSRTVIAEKCGISESLIAYHFGTMTDFKRTVMRHAIKNERLGIIAEGLAIRDAHAQKAPEELRARALASLSEGV